MSFFVPLTYIIITLSWNPIVNVDEIIYGMIISKKRTMSHIIYYNITINKSHLSENQENIALKVIKKTHHDLSKIIEELQVSPQLYNIPKNQIFIKLLYSANYIPSLSDDTREKILLDDEELANNYKKLNGVPFLETFKTRWCDLLTFGKVSIDLKDEKLLPNTVILFRDNLFFIGFIVSTPEKLSPRLVLKVKYRSEAYFVVTNKFYCANPLSLHNLMLIKLIRESKGRKEILHPCIPKKTFHPLKSPFIRTGICGEEFISDDIFNFVGSFDKKKCEMLIESVIKEKKLDSTYYKHSNFSHIHLPLPLDHSHPLILYNPIIRQDELNGDNFLDVLRKKELEACKSAKVTTEVTWQRFDCLRNVYFSYVLENILNFKGGKVILRTEEPDTDVTKLLFMDPRVGFSLYDELRLVDISEINNMLINTNSSEERQLITTMGVQSRITMASATEEKQITSTSVVQQQIPYRTYWAPIAIQIGIGQCLSLLIIIVPLIFYLKKRGNFNNFENNL